MPRSRRPDLPALAERLRALRDEWEGRRLDSDPLAFPHRYEEGADREVVAFLAAAFAFGRVASIKTSLERLLTPLGAHPARFLARYGGEPLPALGTFTHRWVRRRDAERLLFAVGAALRKHGSLGRLFAGLDEKETDYVATLSRFFSTLRRLSGDEDSSRGLAFLLATPEGGAACKRAHLFLRWMIRKDALDLGLWTGAGFDGLTPARLLLPMDTHVHRIATYLGLTNRKTADLRAAREATAWLARIEPRDPVSFDWALSRLGILAECVRDPGRRLCERCAVRPVCRVARRVEEVSVSA